jgi:porin
MPRSILGLIVGAGILSVMLAVGCAARADDDLWQRDKLTGDWSGERTALKNDGVEVNLNYIGETLGNVVRGTKRGFVYQGRAELSVDADLGKSMNWKGGQFHTTAYQIERMNGGIGANYTGSLSDPSNIEARSTTRLFTLWLQQSVLDDQASVRFGQLAADDEFLTSPTASKLINGTFGWPDLMSANLTNGGPAYPLANPGVRVQVNPAPSISVLAGAFSGNPAGSDCSGDAQACNRHGTIFSLSGGTLWITEIQYGINQGEQAAGKPEIYKVGVWYQNGSFADQRYGFDGSGTLVSLASGASVASENHSGNRGIYVVADRMFWRAADKSQSLSGFVRAGAAPSDRNQVSFYADGGLGYTGLIPGRAQDTFTFGVAYARISGDASDLDRDQRLFGTPGYPVRDQETVFELSYLAQITPWLILQPDIQYISHPGGSVPNPNNASGGAISDALVVGIRASIAF